MYQKRGRRYRGGVENQRAVGKFKIVLADPPPPIFFFFFCSFGIGNRRRFNRQIDIAVGKLKKL